MTEYKSVSWSEEPVSVDKLQQMATNDQALFEMKPATAIKHVGASRDKGMKILAGSQLFQPSKTWSTNHTVYFGNFFSAGCNPVVIPGISSYPQRGLNLSVHGIGNVPVADHRGFRAYVWCDDRDGNKSVLTHPYYVTYIAIGF